MSWKAEYIFLIIFSTAIDYFVGLKIQKTTKIKQRKQLLYLSLISNLGVLFAFKYFNFFSENFLQLFEHFNLFKDSATFEVLLPVGISFYTFQSMSYTIDVYRNKIRAEANFVKFALYVSFFPQLVAGPIERAKNLLYQFDKKHLFNYQRVTYGIKLIAWGFFQKIVIADNMARFVDIVYNNPQNYYGWDILLVAFLFAVQIYADFSGYTDIARGAAKIMGYELMINFKRPYFASSFKEFWKRWHISLSTWFRDYVYFALGGKRSGTKKWMLAILITFTLSGLWHGANWTFILWGIYHAILYLMEAKLNGIERLNNIFKWKYFYFLKILIVFLATLFGWLIFRSNSISDFFILFKHLFSEILSWPVISFDRVSILVNILLVFLLLMVWIIERKRNIIDFVSAKPFWQRWMVYYFIVLGIVGLGNWGMEPFIYFQF